MGEGMVPISPQEQWAAPAFFSVYLIYLFWRQENELLHWVSLVALPTLLVLWLRREAGGSGLGSVLASFGLSRENLGRGWLVALGVGVVLGMVQLFLSRSGAASLDAFRTGRAVYLLPLAFVLLLFLAGFTEEFFFRGFLQTRLEALFNSKALSLVVTSFLFGLYHLPYAYFNPNWPSAGDWSAAWGASLGQGIPAGLIFGGLYLYTRKNLLVCVVLHALVDAFPAMALIRFGDSWH
ncbi:MAG: CPBP family intramembrane metalloprotease [Gemmatimonadetes bacterium]|nr:CPBP family intramembrane metalloprotease [Gemmatimonadota bacterium]